MYALSDTMGTVWAEESNISHQRTAVQCHPPERCTHQTEIQTHTDQQVPDSTGDAGRSGHPVAKYQIDCDDDLFGSGRTQAKATQLVDIRTDVGARSRRGRRRREVNVNWTRAAKEKVQIEYTEANREVSMKADTCKSIDSLAEEAE